MDFQIDTTTDGRTLKVLNVIDEFTREALAVDVLGRLALQLGAPAYVRFDNGPEFVANAVNDWCLFKNTRIEAFNGRLRDELLNAWRFDSLPEARVINEDWRRDYNANRPHTAHGELTPTEFALQWSATHQPQVDWTTSQVPPHDYRRTRHLDIRRSSGILKEVPAPSERYSQRFGEASSAGEGCCAANGHVRTK